MGSSLPNVFGNSSSSLYIGTHASIELPTHASRIHAPSAMLSTQNSNLGLMQEINGKMLKSAAGFSGSSAYMFGAESSLLETRPTIEDTAFNSAEPSTQSLNEPLLDADISSFGLLGQISCNFNLSDLAADFSPSSGFFLSICMGTCICPVAHIFCVHPCLHCESVLDIMLDLAKVGGLLCVPYLKYFLQFIGKARYFLYLLIIGENKRLDTISEGLSFDGYRNK
ncbi:hypothetical protein Gogos_019250 [Gossypium gossypioides]|uniref:Uncharacterized protein n=1 Tax=Gossypium gossypioides TaxID=34282 RepID=A0A7J9BGT5_GOSGO|nr:hypothetical protein [Gossypium gossypioides]